jgi:hypothetical protein
MESKKRNREIKIESEGEKDRERVCFISLYYKHVTIVIYDHN